MGLAGKLLGAPSAGDSLESVTLGDTDGVDHLILGEHGVDGDLLLEVLLGPVDLFFDGSAVDLDLDEVCLLLLALENLHLKTRNN